MKASCKHCGDDITIESIQDEKICEECFLMMEDSHNNIDESFSDADAGL